MQLHKISSGNVVISEKFKFLSLYAFFDPRFVIVLIQRKNESDCKPL